MRFSQAWSHIATQNNVLRIATLFVCATSFIAILLLIKLAMKEPLIIERSCFNSALESKNINQTPQETENFIREALNQRLNSDALLNSDYFSLDELRSRENELLEFKKRDIKQKIFVNSIQSKNGNYIVDIDRLLVAGTIRSAFQVSLLVSISQTPRSNSNPYGLVVIKIQQNKPEENNNGK